MVVASSSSHVSIPSAAAPAADAAATVSSSPPPLSSLGVVPLVLPICIWSEIVDYCTLSDSRSLFQTCRWFYGEAEPFIESKRHFIRLDQHPSHPLSTSQLTLPPQHCQFFESPGNITVLSTGTTALHDMRLLVYQPFLTKWNCLATLDLSRYATDDVLNAIQPHLPLLQKLYMVKSYGVTCNGIMTLCATNHRRTNLRYLDITDCKATTYHVTIELRHQMHPNLIIRRIPSWMEGHYQATLPFKLDYTYWADGSYLHVKRPARSIGAWCGYVKNQVQRRGHYKDQWANVMRTVEFVDGEAQLNDVHRFIAEFRPTPQEYDAELRKDGNRTVLVGRCLSSSDPCRFRLKPIFGALPVGRAKRIPLKRTIIHPDPSVQSRRSTGIIRRMLVTPLEHSMPPAHIVEQIRLFV